MCQGSVRDMRLRMIICAVLWPISGAGGRWQAFMRAGYVFWRRVADSETILVWWACHANFERMIRSLTWLRLESPRNSEIVERPNVLLWVSCIHNNLETERSIDVLTASLCCAFEKENTRHMSEIRWSLPALKHVPNLIAALRLESRPSTCSWPCDATRQSRISLRSKAPLRLTCCKACMRCG
jgi:hypothetical protein